MSNLHTELFFSLSLYSLFLSLKKKTWENDEFITGSSSSLALTGNKLSTKLSFGKIKKKIFFELFVLTGQTVLIGGFDACASVN